VTTSPLSQVPDWYIRLRHGQEDYLVGQRYNLPLLSPVDADGNFTGEAVAGLECCDGNQAVIQALSEAGSLLKEPYVHKYPTIGVRKKPTIYRATEQVLLVEGFREEALWRSHPLSGFPPKVKTALQQWCRSVPIGIPSTQLVPIPVFYETTEALLTEETIAHVQAIVAKRVPMLGGNCRLRSYCQNNTATVGLTARARYDGCLV